METLIEKTKQLDQLLKSYNFLSSGKNNPFNFIGEQHNECLSYLLNKGDTTIHKLVKNSFTFMKQNDSGFIKEFDKSFEEKVLLICDNLSTKFKKEQEITASYLDEIELNENIKSELYWLIETILGFDVDVHSFVSLVEGLNNWEHRVKTSSYEDTDKSVLLMGSAIARHSTWFWTREKYLELEDVSLVSKAKRKKKCLRTVFTVCADVIGGVGGAVPGTVAGGPVGGAIGAVVTGGAMSGAAYSIFR